MPPRPLQETKKPDRFCDDRVAIFQVRPRTASAPTWLGPPRGRALRRCCRSPRPRRHAPPCLAPRLLRHASSQLAPSYWRAVRVGKQGQPCSRRQCKQSASAHHPPAPPPRHKCFVPTSSRPHPQADARELGPEFWAEHCPGGFDVVLSDM